MRATATRRQLDRLWSENRLLWISFGFAAGICGYVLPPQEPLLPVLVLVAAGYGGLTVWRHVRGRASPGSIVLAAVLVGCVAMAGRSHLVDAPRLARPVTALVEGIVLDREQALRGPRLRVAVTGWNMAEPVPGETPSRVRLSVPAASQARVGDRIQARARLFPPSGPVVPGGYDFSFRAYFQGLGATGYAFGAPRIIAADDAGWLAAATRRLEAVRHGIAAHIRATLPAGDGSALAVALLVGDRSGLSKAGEEALRQAGLAHVLAISGLHMALFAGGAYTVFLMLISISQTAALHVPAHKIAAVGALLAAVCYLCLSGASVATQRSFIMIALVFLAVLTDRRGLTLRSVALAGLALLLLAPERLFYPGFQMSFAAVLCLVAVYQSWRDRDGGAAPAAPPANPVLRVGKTLVLWAFGLFVTAGVAGAATGIIGAHHFGRIAPFGLVGNMLGMPLFSVVIMPMGVVAVVLMPFGLASYPLQLMERALTWLLDIAEWTAGLDQSGGGLVPFSSPVSLLLLSGLFCGLLVRGRWRWTACLPVVIAGGLYLGQKPADIYISERGELLAARDAAGRLRVDRRRADFATASVLEAEGISLADNTGWRLGADQKNCDPRGCVVTAYGPAGAGLTDAGPPSVAPLLIAIPNRAEALDLDCAFADMVVAMFDLPDTCGADLALDRTKITAGGAAALWLDAGGRARDGAAAMSPADDRMARPRVVRIKWARTNPPRPWHR